MLRDIPSGGGIRFSPPSAFTIRTISSGWKGFFTLQLPQRRVRSWMSYVNELSSYNVDLPGGVMHP